MVDDPSGLAPDARARLARFRDAMSPSTADTERALRGVLARAAEEALGEPSPRPRRGAGRRRWPAVAAAIVLCSLSGLAAASVLRGARFEPAADVVQQAALSASARAPATEPATTRRASGPRRASTVVMPLAPVETERAPRDEAPAEPVERGLSDQAAREPGRQSSKAQHDPDHSDRSKVDQGPKRASTPPERAAAPVAAAQLTEERSLLAHAQRAVARGDFDRALSYTSRHAARYVDGLLAPERRTIQAIALCGSGDVEAGHQVIADLREAAPRHPGLVRAERSCE